MIRLLCIFKYFIQDISCDIRALIKHNHILTKLTITTRNAYEMLQGCKLVDNILLSN